MGDAPRIRIGNQTSFAAASPVEPFDYALAHGFDAFEWFPDRRPDGQGWHEGDLAPAARADIRRAAREHDVALSVHGSWQATPLTAAGRERLFSQVEFAAAIGASTFVVHLVHDEGPDRYVEAVVPLAARLAGHGILLAVENTPDTTPGDINELFRRLGGRDEAGIHGAGLCLDVGHANLCADTRHDYLAYVDRLDPGVAIRHVHLHENWGDQDSHLTVFTGPAAVDASGVAALADRLVRRRFAGSIILEQWPQPPGLLDAARNRLAALLAARRPAGHAA